MGSGHHLSLSLSGEMWNQLLSAALPFSIAEGMFDLTEGAGTLLRQLQVTDRVTGLLEDNRAPQPLLRFSKRAKKFWDSNRASVFDRLNQMVSVEGTWKLQLDDLGTDLRYGEQKVTADAYVRGTAEGRITFLRDNLSIPFSIERRLGASVALGRIRFSEDEDAVIGNVQDLAVHLGDNTVLQLLGRVIEFGIEQQLENRQAVPVLTREQVAGLVGGVGGPLQLEMGVDDLELDVSDGEMTLKVRFGFSEADTSRQIPKD